MAATLAIVFAATFSINIFELIHKNFSLAIPEITAKNHADQCSNLWGGISNKGRINAEGKSFAGKAVWYRYLHPQTMFAKGSSETSLVMCFVSCSLVQS